jgi:hypothetical protein
MKKTLNLQNRVKNFSHRVLFSLMATTTCYGADSGVAASDAEPVGSFHLVKDDSLVRVIQAQPDRLPEIRESLERIKTATEEVNKYRNLALWGFAFNADSKLEALEELKESGPRVSEIRELSAKFAQEKEAFERERAAVHSEAESGNGVQDDGAYSQRFRSVLDMEAELNSKKDHLRSLFDVTLSTHMAYDKIEEEVKNSVKAQEEYLEAILAHKELLAGVLASMGES